MNSFESWIDDMKSNINKPLICLDLETKGFIEHGQPPEIVVFSYCNDKVNGVDDDRELLEDILLTYTPIIHNASFDVSVLRLLGHEIPFGGFHDTMLLANALNSVRNVGLSDLAAEYELEQKKLKFNMNAWVKAGFPDTPELREYALADAVAGWQLWNKLLETVASSGDSQAWGLYTFTDLPVCEAIMEMQLNGWHILEDKAFELHDELTKEINEATNAIIDKYPTYPTEKVYKKEHPELSLIRSEPRTDGKDGLQYVYEATDPFNPNSNDHKAWAMEQEGWTPRKFTKQGKPKVDKFEMANASFHFPIAKQFIGVSKASKLKSSFIEVLINDTDDNNILRGQFNQAGTVTGRFSSSSPNLQNIPARGEMGKKIRSCFTAKPGNVLVGGDLSNIEARILAHYLEKGMQDSTMANAFRKGLDLHWENTKAWGLAVDPTREDGKSDPGRDIAKTVLYLAIYGGTEQALAQQLDISLEEAGEIFKTFYKYATSVMSLKELVWYTMRKRGYIKTLFGRRLYYPDINSKNRALRSRAERQVFNALIQGGAADILKDLMANSVELANNFGAMWVAQVHDECIFELEPHKADAFAVELTQAWSCEDYLCIPTPADFSVGYSWSDIK
jgi:DNA polymerase I-like protein with 3'-5' exonuclease and polymerase domains